jgi:hypothetical protein
MTVRPQERTPPLVLLVGDRVAGVPAEVRLNERGTLPSLGEEVEGIECEHLGQLAQDQIRGVALIMLN